MPMMKDTTHRYCCYYDCAVTAAIGGNNISDEADNNKRTGNTMDNRAGSTFPQSKSNVGQFPTYTSNKKKPPTIYPKPSNFFAEPSTTSSVPAQLASSPSPHPPLPPVPIVKAEELQTLVNSHYHPPQHHHQLNQNNTSTEPSKRYVTFPAVSSSLKVPITTKKALVQPPSRWLDTQPDLPKCRICHQTVTPHEAVLGRPCLHGPFHVACIEAEEELCIAAARATNRNTAPQLHCPVCLGVMSSIAFDLSNEIPSIRLPFANVMKPSAPANMYNGTGGGEIVPITDDKIEYVQQRHQREQKQEKEEQRQHSKISATVFVPSGGCKMVECDRFKFDVDVHIIHHYPQPDKHHEDLEDQPSYDTNQCNYDCKDTVRQRYENRKHQHQHRHDHYYHYNRRRSSTGCGLSAPGKNHNHSRHGSTQHRRR